jgi:hypothetical protein
MYNVTSTLTKAKRERAKVILLGFPARSSLAIFIVPSNRKEISLGFETILPSSASQGETYRSKIYLPSKRMKSFIRKN